MSDDQEQQVEQLLRRTKPTLSDLGRQEGVAPARVHEAIGKVLDEVLPIAKELTGKEMEALLLKLLGAQSMTGFEVASRLEKANVRLKEGGEGVLYGLFGKLESAGCVEGEWSERGDRMVKIYRVTEKGRKSLSTVKVEAARLSAWFDLVRDEV
jgi:DNA-binding PadR family transcriptional regulator